MILVCPKRMASGAYGAENRLSLYIQHNMDVGRKGKNLGFTEAVKL